MQSNPRHGSRVFAAGAALSLILLGTPTSAAAAAAPVGGCSPRFELTTVNKLVRSAPPEYADDIRKADRNNDGYLCIKVDKTGTVYTDNNAPLANS